jgi:hypothetical protein
MKARDWLVQKGLAKGTRGKFSAAAHAALQDAIANGEKFSDYPKGDAPVKATKVKPSKGETPRESTGIVDLAPYRFEENSYRAVEVESGVERSLRSACNTCRVSLVVCYCTDPIIVARDGGGSVSVRIEAR